METTAIAFPHSVYSMEVGDLCADGMSNLCLNREIRRCSPSQLFASMTAHGIVPCPGARVSHKLDVCQPSLGLET